MTTTIDQEWAFLLSDWKKSIISLLRLPGCCDVILKSLIAIWPPINEKMAEKEDYPGTSSMETWKKRGFW